MMEQRSKEKKQDSWRCQHPRRARQLITSITLDHASLSSPPLTITTDQHFLKTGRIRVQTSSKSPIATHVDIRREILSLLSLDPKRRNLRRWLDNISQKKRRWQGITSLAHSRDSSLSPLPLDDGRTYDDHFIPLIFKIALLQHGDPDALQALMSLSLRGRQRWKLLSMICESQSANLALLRWRHDLGLQRHDRLLAVRRLAMAETEPQRWQPPHCDPAQERTQVLQYWQGDAPPEEIQKEIDGWRQKSSLLAHMLWNERQASTWIQENYAADDARRFEQCWHPAMRADFLRILKIAKDGGVYLDCDTPQLHDEGLQRWHQLTQFCVAKNSLALCINTLAGPGYCSHYAVNCCIWSTAEHPFARHWVNAYRQRLDQILATTSRTPGDIHALGPDLLSELLDEMLLSQETSLESIGWNGARIPWLKQGAHSVILLDTDNYRRVFNNPFDGFCSYANCNDPRDWRVKSS